MSILHISVFHGVTLVCITLLGLFCFSAQAQILDDDFKPRIVLQIEPKADDFRDKNYAYRKIYNEKTVAVMLYGFYGTPQQAANDNILIPKDRKNLGAFFKNHVDRIKRDYIGDQHGDSVKIMTGQTAFTSTQMNRGIDIEPARMAGITIPAGKFTFGGGYTWGEKNPALMMPTGDGMFAGFSYDTGNLGFQASFLTSGQEVLGWEVGNNDYRYSSLMLGTSFKMNKRTAVTATLQFRNDNDPGTTGDQQVIATVGTAWRW